MLNILSSNKLGYTSTVFPGSVEVVGKCFWCCVSLGNETRQAITENQNSNYISTHVLLVS